MGSRRALGLVPLLALLVVTSAVVSVGIGPVSLAPLDVFRSALAHVSTVADPLSRIDQGIVWNIRLPRVLAAAAVGAGLAACGVVMQTLTRNALADPYLLGLSSGAALGAVITLSLGLTEWLPFAAFVGAAAALLTTLALARSGLGMSPVRTVLAGVAVGQVTSAASSFVIFWSASGDSYREILSWLLGSVAGVNLGEAGLMWALLVPGVALLLLLARPLDAFIFGDEAATAAGVSARRYRLLLLTVVALLVGIMVAFVGSIGFVGLLVPHAVRWALGTSRHASVLPCAALTGAIFMVWADTLARTVFAPQEVPVGVITALLGVPIFVVLLRREGRA
ncbi:iron chelate uptake ABC transporter family permease subunit [Micrococcales bacterium 31B]|nr:iron chelate uptake ABC transporter family permease subunit [Micrococcales bacterium 31B]